MSWSADDPGPSDEPERTTEHEQHPISGGDLDSDCLQRLITVHIIVSLQLFFTGPVLVTTRRRPLLLSLRFFPFPSVPSV